MRVAAEPQEISAQATTESAQQNIRTIAKLEQEAIDKRSRGEKFSDVFTRFMGSMTFVVLHLVWLGGWFLVNLGAVPAIEPFDPFPFGILTLIVSTEGVFLAIFVLISQNRMGRLANQLSPQPADQPARRAGDHQDPPAAQGHLRPPGDRRGGRGDPPPQREHPPGGAGRGAEEKHAGGLAWSRIVSIR